MHQRQRETATTGTQSMRRVITSGQRSVTSRRDFSSRKLREGRMSEVLSEMENARTQTQPSTKIRHGKVGAGEIRLNTQTLDSSNLINLKLTHNNS